ncbi:glycoside hydrolase family 31 protein [Prauserella rugosa]|uniref:Alpha-D-xyloside xylohydrolase n=1 Tax=Prauserella rugosa TaxID=43354 RepID=A0A660CFP5_9PSEU|nr:TIM-barrel domain-containing protein [Prauserella rugosa]TWH20339.1 alpha-D-xyloside xylohydrolase [Prauserella rugosa]
MTEHHLLREVEEVTRRTGTAGGGVTARVRAVSCRRGSDGIGYLTGESLAEQGIETTMPNLPELDTPPLDTLDVTVGIEWIGRDTLRLTVTPADRPLSAPAGTEHGIVRANGQALAGGDAGVTVEDRDEAVVVTGGRMRVVMERRPFALSIEDTETGALLLDTAGKLRQVAGLPIAPAVLLGDSTRLNLELGPDEEILGFGEQFGRFVKNGQRLRLRVEDALGTGTGLSYKPAPVWWSTAGYLALVNTGATVEADVGHSRNGVLGIEAECGELDLYVVAAPEPKRALTGYAELTGRGCAPPLWALGYWLGRCRYHSSAEMVEVGRMLREHEVPADILHADPDWLVVDRLNCDFIWNTERFGDRAEFVKELERLGLRLSVWELPYLDPASPRYAEAAERGYLVTDAEGAVAGIAGTPVPDDRPRALLDFTNPDARRWWQQLHGPFLDDGVAVFKTDFGEGLPDDVRLADGTAAEHAHNLYPLQYNGAVSDAIAEHTGRPPLVWGRSGWAGSHRYPAQWGGDAESTVSGMRATLRGGLSHAMSMPGLWGHDIGGFFGPELTPELYVRWTQFGALSPLMRAHGLRPREPWAFGEQALTIARDWIRLRYSLLPYLWQVAHESARNGWPMLRPLTLEFPRDALATTRDDAFLLGSDLLAVPIFDDGGEPVRRRFYVPEGGWTDLITGARYTGPALHTDTVPLDRMPVLVRDGAVLPRVEVGQEVRGTDDLVDAPWQLHVYGPAPATVELLDFAGEPFTVEMDSSGGDSPIPVTIIRHDLGETRS